METEKKQIVLKTKCYTGFDPSILQNFGIRLEFDREGSCTVDHIHFGSLDICRKSNNRIQCRNK